MNKEFERFVKTKFTLEIRQRGKILFRSKRDGVSGLLLFIKKYGRKYKNLVFFDKVVGRAAALLFVYLKAKEVYGVIGSKPAARVLYKFKIKYYFKKTVPGIINKTKTGPCPMEKLSKGKTPEKLYNLLKK